MRLAAVALLVLAGCSLNPVSIEPALPMPPRPRIQFFLCGENVCLSQGDAAALNKYMEKLDAFEASRMRVLKGAEPPK